METNTDTTTAPALRAQAVALDAEAAASFERCDTDGFLSQWGNGLMAQQRRMEADLLEAGGTYEFPALFDLDGNWVPAKLIDGQYGTSWMILDTNGRRTGQYVAAFPVRRSTIVRKGFLEGYVTRPAKIDMRGNNLCTVRPVHVATDRPQDGPLSIVSTDRWAD